METNRACDDTLGCWNSWLSTLLQFPAPKARRVRVRVFQRDTQEWVHLAEPPVGARELWLELEAAGKPQEHPQVQAAQQQEQEQQQQDAGAASPGWDWGSGWDDDGEGLAGAAYLASPDAAPLISISADGREGVFLRPHPQQRSYQRQQFTIVGYRFVMFSGGPVLLSWCKEAPSGTGACPDPSGLEAMFAGKDYPNSTQAEVLVGEPTMCTCARELLTALGGEAALQDLLAAGVRSAVEAVGGDNSLEDQDEEEEQLWRVVPYQHNQRQYKVLAPAGSAGFTECALVGYHGADPFCFSCENHQRHCMHVAKVKGSQGSAGDGTASSKSNWLDGETAERRLLEVLDLETGKIKLACLSRSKLPTHLEPGSPLLGLIEDLATGRSSFPAVCKPDTSQPCASCGQLGWEEVEGQHDCSIFLSKCVARARFSKALCSCGATQHVDGQEFGVLRFSESTAFGLDLLYQWREKMKSGGGIAFNTFWRDYLSSPWFQGRDIEERKQWLALRGDFQQAALDFIELQDLDYAAAFCCEHLADGGDLRADCITLGIHLNQLWVVHPNYDWEPQVPVSGSLHSSRVFLDNKKARAAVRQYSGVQHQQRGQGLSEEEHGELVQLLEGLSQEHAGAGALLPFVRDLCHHQGGRMVAAAGHRELLYCLATEAPVCQVLRPQSFSAVQRLLAEDNPTALLPLPEQRLLHRASPIVFNYLRPSLGQGLPQPARDLLSTMLAVAQRCGVPHEQADAAVVAADAVAASASASSRGAAAYQQHREAGGRPPETWSRDEAFLRMGCWGGPKAREPWQPTQHGGSDILHPIPLYRMDAGAARRSPDSSTCTKHKDQHKNLSPGLLVISCGKCRKVVYIQVLTNAESVGLVIHAIRTRWHVPPRCLVYDNNCNAHVYALNRDPAFWHAVEMYIDATHFRGHTACCLAYDTGRYPGHIVNSPLSEQINSQLRKIENSVSYMRQTTFLRFLRTYCALHNERLDDQALGNSL